MAESALDCFISLLDSIPGWIADLEGIVTSATERQKDILHENQPVDAHQDGSQPPARPRKRSKSSSIRTKRSDELKDGSPNGLEALRQNESLPTLVQTQVPHMTPSDALRLAQRKRKTASACSDRQSGPLKYRSRSMVVVYYDGEIQNRFENLVRAIGTRRNALRKGRTSAQVYELSPKTSNGDDGANGEDKYMLQPRVAYRSARMRQSPQAGKHMDGLEAYDKLDGYLEKAQAQCERAAHQILRDGDCGLEFKTAKEQFHEAQAHCETEIPIWRKRVEEFVEKERRNEEQRRRKEEEEERKGRRPPPNYTSTEKLMADPFAAAAPLEVDMEPDDSDGGGDESGHDFTINLMQLAGPRPYMQTSRLTAV